MRNIIIVDPYSTGYNLVEDAGYGRWKAASTCGY